ncbi:hypothetical protein AB4254_11970 [Vibrio breoganii]
MTKAELISQLKTYQYMLINSGSSGSDSGGDCSAGRSSCESKCGYNFSDWENESQCKAACEQGYYACD